MDELLIPIEFRADESRESPGRLFGVLLPYSVKAGDRPEMFEQGALRIPDDGVLLREMHRRDSPIMRIRPFLEGSELRVDEPFPNTTAGRDAATNLRPPNAIYSGLSVEFKAIREIRRSGVRVIQEGTLTGAGLVDLGAYRQAIAEVRQEATRRRRVWL